MDPASVLKALGFLKSVAQLGPGGQQVRNEMIARANQLSSAILLIASQTMARLTQALYTEDLARKKDLLAALEQHELVAFSQMNEVCANIYQSANALQHWSSSEWANVNIGGHGEAREMFDVLTDGESGMQRLFSEMLAAPAQMNEFDRDDVDTWIRQTVTKVAAISDESTAVTQRLANVL